MNRCSVCDKTDEDDPKAGIAIFNGTETCLECVSAINQNLEDLSVNDEIAIDYFPEFVVPEAIVQDDNWLQAPLPEVSE